MIKTTAKVVQEEFNATVVYGDTDSGTFCVYVCLCVCVCVCVFVCVCVLACACV